MLFRSARHIVLSMLEPSLATMVLSYAIPVAAVAIILPLLISVLYQFKKIADVVASVLIPYQITNKKEITSKLFLSSVLFVFCYMAFVSIPIIIDILSLPSLYGTLSILPIIAMCLLIWDIISFLLSSRKQL